MQTIEQTPVFVHAGPFANIAHGNSSIIADQIALKLVEKDGYVITEAGFGADIGFEKFCNIKCRQSNLKPNCVVLVVTIRALKMHGGGPPVSAGKPLDTAYTTENLKLLDDGCGNMQHHIKNSKIFGLSTVVCINGFETDTIKEWNLVKEKALQAGATSAVICTHWSDGGAGAIDLGKAVIEACKNDRLTEGTFKFLYPLNMTIKDKMIRVCFDIYGAKEIYWSPNAEDKLVIYSKLGYENYPICVAKTHLSLSCNPNLKGVPSGFKVMV